MNRCRQGSLSSGSLVTTRHKTPDTRHALTQSDIEIILSYYLEYLTMIFWALDKNERVLGQKTRKRENGTEKGTRHCFAPRLRNPPACGGNVRRYVSLYPPQEGGWGLDCFDSPVYGAGGMIFTRWESKQTPRPRKRGAKSLTTR